MFVIPDAPSLKISSDTVLTQDLQVTPAMPIQVTSENFLRVKTHTDLQIYRTETVCKPSANAL